MTVIAAGRTQVAARFGGGSYQSASDQRLHFGLGPARVVDRVEVTWPSGRRSCYQGLAAGTGYRLREGDAVPKPLAGFPAAIQRRVQIGGRSRLLQADLSEASPGSTYDRLVERLRRR